MPQGNILSKNCSGNVLPATFVKFDPFNPEKVIACGAATDTPIGVAQESAYLPPIPQQTGTQYAGTTTSPPIRIYAMGCDNVLLQAGTGGWTAGDKLTSDASGNGITATTGNIYGAIAEETRNVGEWGRVLVVSPAKA